MNRIWILSNKLYEKPGVVQRVCARILELISMKIGDNSITARSSIGYDTVFMHRGIGCVTHPNTVIGNYCHIAANVTFGAKWSSKDADNSLAPVVGDYVEIGAGAVLLGGIRVGNHASIGANAVVLTDVPDYGVAVGVPARVVKINERT